MRIRSSSSSVAPGYHSRTCSTSGAVGVVRSTSSRRRWTALPTSVALSPPSPSRPRSGRFSRMPATRMAKYLYEHCSNVDSAVNERRRTRWSGGSGGGASAGSSGACAPATSSGAVKSASCPGSGSAARTVAGCSSTQSSSL